MRISLGLTPITIKSTELINVVQNMVNGSNVFDFSRDLSLLFYRLFFILMQMTKHIINTLCKQTIKTKKNVKE